jgi:hypothetical protein
MKRRLLAIACALAGCSKGGFDGAPDLATAGPLDGAMKDAASPDLLATATQVQGTILGESFGPAAALSTTESDAFGGMTTLVDIADASGVCTLAMSNAGLPDGHVIAMSLYGPTVGPLTGSAILQVSSSFTPQANSALVHWSKVVSQCPAAQDTGMSGTVTITRVDPLGIEGRFVIQFQGGALNGSFVAPPCNALSSWNPPHGPTC